MNFDRHNRNKNQIEEIIKEYFAILNLQNLNNRFLPDKAQFNCRNV